MSLPSKNLSSSVLSLSSLAVSFALAVCSARSCVLSLFSVAVSLFCPLPDRQEQMTPQNIDKTNKNEILFIYLDTGSRVY